MGSASSAVPPSASHHEATGKFGFPIYHAETREQWRSWLEHHHTTERGVWLCSWRPATNKPRCPYPEVVEEALCFGWIDSTVGTLDDDRAVQMITPRKPKSSWTRLNRQRVAEMEAQGLMTDAGRRIVSIAQANGWWTIYDPVEDLIEPHDLAVALDRCESARTHWDAFPPGARKAMLWWVLSASREETRANRILAITEKASLNQRAQG